ncbi:hypothetical protein TYRP_006972 [Tyrophagus putrescentiae]|nr:hypothetical protein TYRP_006972 [Tyrophagus putrescentiae]
MEKELEEVAGEAVKENGIIGYLAADSHGLCLTATGAADKGLSSTLVRISKHLAKLNDNESENSMVLGIETDRYRVLAKTLGQTTTAVYKKY